MGSWEDHLENDIKHILIDEETITARVTAMAKEISDDYRDLDLNELVVIGILRGAVIFMSDLIRQLDLPVTIDFMAISSYTKGTHTSGTVRIIKDIAESITDKHVMIVEDIVDTGLTLECLCDMLIARKPKSLKICSLLDKPSRRLVKLDADYIGFEIPNEFVVGYGLDFEGHFRHIPYVGVLKNRDK